MSVNELKRKFIEKPNGNDGEVVDEIKKLKIPKRKIALFMGYCGENYFGLQRNVTDKEHRTIEDELVEALNDIEAITEDQKNNMFKMQFQRAARTDKNVSAGINVFSIKLHLIENIVNKLNERLPDHCHVYDIIRATNSFDSKNFCSGRTYHYLLPTFAFCPIEQLTTESYRLDEKQWQIAHDSFQRFLGTNNYHNFTSGKKFTDPSAKRYMKNLTISKPFIDDNDSLEYCLISITGQSFMMHQIRKMIGTVIAIVRGMASSNLIDECWTADKIDIPKAPGLGLMLDSLDYRLYNIRFENDGIHELIELEKYREEIDKFKKKFIYPKIYEKERTTKSMFKWLQILPCHSFGTMSPGYPPGAYIGPGRALYMIEKYGEKKEEKIVNITRKENDDKTEIESNKK